MRRVLSAVSTLLVIAGATPAHAEEEPNGHGIVGGALLGAELTLIGESIANIEPPWPYAVGGALGALAGGYAGSVVEEQAERKASLVLLAAGVGLVIPTAVWVGNATQPRPSADEVVLLPPRMHVGFAAERSPSLSLELLRGRF